MSSKVQRTTNLAPEEKRALLAWLLQQKADKPATVPLSFAQERMWFLDQLEPGNSTYNMGFAYRLSGPLDVTALEKSFNKIVQRHEVLRTTFSVINGQPIQVIAPNLTLPLPVIDLCHLAEVERKGQIQRFISEERRRVFELSHGPLLRTTLLQLDMQEHILLLTMHHIISDGWSLGVLLRELATLYEAHCTGKVPVLPELPIQYGDFAVWQREWLQGEVLENQLDYWKQQLDGISPTLQLPTDRPRPAVQTHRGAMQSLVLSRALSVALKSLSRQAGTTLFMTLLAAFKVLLYRYAGQDDVAVGIPIANRNRAEIENLIGFFLNTLVLRTDFSDNDLTFRTLLSRVRKVALDAYTHQDIPFEKLLEELQPARDLSRPPLFQVFFNMINIEERDFKLSGLMAEQLLPTEPDAKFDLTLYVRELNDEIHLRLVYNTDLFCEERIIAMLEQFKALLGDIVENPDGNIAHFSLITPQAEKLLPNPTHSLGTDWAGAVHTHFSQQAQHRPDQPAVLDKQKVWTYQELEARSNQLANHLRAKGIQPQDIVAFYGHRSASLVWVLLGILKAGAAFTILDPAYPAERLIDYCRIVQPRGWIQLKVAGALPEALEEFLMTSSSCYRLELPQDTSYDYDPLANSPTSKLDVKIGPDDLAYIAFTSGTTGVPKAVVGTHRPLSHFIQWYNQTFDLQTTDRFGMLSGLSHDPLLRDIFTPLWLGARLYIPDPDDISSDRLMGWMKQNKISIIHLTPAMEQLLTLTTKPGCEQKLLLRYAFFGGDRLTKRNLDRFREVAPSTICVNFYGTTETPQAMSYFIVPDREEDRLTANNNTIGTEIMPLGQGIEDVQLLVLNRAQQLAGVGELGEIYIRTPYLAKEYLGDETLTRERFIPNPFSKIPGDRLYRTGDLGRYRPDGLVEFAGRYDQQVKIRGYRIELGEIETILKQHALVRESIVITHERVSGDKHLAAYIVSDQQQTLPVNQLRIFLRDKLPEYMIPSAFVLLDTLPLTPNRKVDRQALPAPENIRHDTQETYIAPRDELELQLTKIWENVLNIRPIGVRDDFFDLGGHSLLAVRLFAQLEKVFGKSLPLATLFQAPTIEQLVRVVQDEGWRAPWASLVPIQPQGSKPPFFCVHAVGGNVLSLRDLARYLGNDQPFYALQSQGLNGKERPPARVEDMAAYYIEEIRTVQPEGPYYLGGQSSGGLVAFEMAQQLQAHGEKVAILALIDTYNPGTHRLPTGVSFRNRISFHLLTFIRLGPIYVLERTRSRAKKIKFLLERGMVKIAKKIYVSLERPEPQSIRYTYVREIIRQAVKSYRPQIYEGRITIFRATNTIQAYLEGLPGAQQRWQGLATEGLETYDISGAHNLEQEPYVGILAKKLSSCLQEAQVAVYQQVR